MFNCQIGQAVERMVQPQDDLGVDAAAVEARDFFDASAKTAWKSNDEFVRKFVYHVLAPSAGKLVA